MSVKVLQQTMRLVIKPHRPLRTVCLYLLLLLFVSVVVLYAADYGFWRSVSNAISSGDGYKELLTEVRGLREENASLHSEITRFSRAEEISDQLRKNNHAELVRLQGEVALLKGELSFYRDIVRSAEIDDGPRVKGLTIKPLHGESRFEYKIVMTYINKQQRYAEGKLLINFLGETDGLERSIAFKELVESGKKALNFRFKHFHLFQGTLRMPDKFVPLQVQVSVADSRGKKYRQNNTFDWISVLN